MKISKVVERISDIEGLEAHSNAIRIRKTGSSKSHK
jgi:histidinol dehydrogenase